MSRPLEPIHAEAHEQAKSRDANVDETSWPEGKSKAWLWVAVTTWLTVLGVPQLGVCDVRPPPVG